jgi:hypothetical protein
LAAERNAAQTAVINNSWFGVNGPGIGKSSLVPDDVELIVEKQSVGPVFLDELEAADIGKPLEPVDNAVSMTIDAGIPVAEETPTERKNRLARERRAAKKAADLQAA